MELIDLILGAVFGVLCDRIYIEFVLPFFKSLRMRKDQATSKKLYFSRKTMDYILRTHKNDYVYNCKIGETSISIPFITTLLWESLDIDVLEHENIITYVNTTKCNYPVHDKLIKRKQKQGLNLFDDPSLFVHSISYDKNHFEVQAGQYSYFQRISYVFDFRKETYNCIFSHVRTNEKLRKKYLKNINGNYVLSDNVIPFGCDTVFVIKIDNEYKICIHERSKETVNYPGAYMVVPSFGFGCIKNISNPLLYSFLREYCEELFNRAETSSEDNHIDPFWFYKQYEEVADILELIKKNEFYIHVIGCGFDAIEGFFNISLLAIVKDDMLSKKIYNNCIGNWETANHNIKFVSIKSKELEAILKRNCYCPSTAFSISRAIKIINSMM